MPTNPGADNEEEVRREITNGRRQLRTSYKDKQSIAREAWRRRFGEENGGDLPPSGDSVTFESSIPPVQGLDNPATNDMLADKKRVTSERMTEGTLRQWQNMTTEQRAALGAKTSATRKRYFELVDVYKEHPDILGTVPRGLGATAAMETQVKLKLPKINAARVAKGLAPISLFVVGVYIASADSAQAGGVDYETPNAECYINGCRLPGTGSWRYR